MTFSKLLAQSLVWRGFYFITLFGVNLVLSRTLQASGSGIVYYIANTFSFVQLVAGLSFENGITFFAAGRQISFNKLLWLCLLWTFVVIVVQLIIFYFLHLSFFDVNTMQYAFCFITGLLLITYGCNLFYASGNFIIPNLILACFNLFFILFVLYKNATLQQESKSEIIVVYFFTFLMQGLFIIIAYIFKNQSWREFSLPEFGEIKNFTRYSLTVLLFNVLLFLVYRVDYYFVRYSSVCTATDLGNYIQASKLGQMLLVVPQIIGSAVYPQVSSGKELAQVSRIILLLMKVIFIFFLILFLIVLVIGNWLFPFLLGSTFQQVQAQFLFLLPGIYGLAIVSIISNFFSGQGNVKISVRAALLALVVVISGDFLFVFRYGIVAAAIVSSVGYLVIFSPYFFRFKTHSNLGYRDFFRLNKDDVLLMKELVGKKRN